MKFLLSLLVLTSFSVLADQCAWNKRTDAKSAINLLKGNDVILWCQNCNETKPSNIFKVKTIDMKKPASQYYEVSITTDKGGKQDIDLAYTYVRTASDMFTNVAHLVGCPSEGATTFIKTGPGVKKVAHYYDQHGKAHVISTEEKEIKISDWKVTPSDRMPASK